MSLEKEIVTVRIIGLSGKEIAVVGFIVPTGYQETSSTVIHRVIRKGNRRSSESSNHRDRNTPSSLSCEYNLGFRVRGFGSGLVKIYNLSGNCFREIPLISQIIVSKEIIGPRRLYGDYCPECRARALYHRA